MLLTRFAIICFCVQFTLIGEFITPFSNMLYRRIEYQADAFAAQHTSARALCGALVTINYGSSPLVMDPVFGLYFSAHPSMVERANALQCYDGVVKGGGWMRQPVLLSLSHF